MRNVVLDEIVLKCFYNICKYYNLNEKIIYKYLKLM